MVAEEPEFLVLTDSPFWFGLGVCDLCLLYIKMAFKLKCGYSHEASWEEKQTEGDFLSAIFSLEDLFGSFLKKN